MVSILLVPAWLPLPVSLSATLSPSVPSSSFSAVASRSRTVGSMPVPRASLLCKDMVWGHGWEHCEVVPMSELGQGHQGAHCTVMIIEFLHSMCPDLLLLPSQPQEPRRKAGAQGNQGWRCSGAPLGFGFFGWGGKVSCPISTWKGFLKHHRGRDEAGSSATVSLLSPWTCPLGQIHRNVVGLESLTGI